MKSMAITPERQNLKKIFNIQHDLNFDINYNIIFKRDVLYIFKSLSGNNIKR